MMSYEMYEDFKETMVRTIKIELPAKNSQSATMTYHDKSNKSFIRNKNGIGQNNPACWTIGKLEYSKTTFC